MLKLWGFFEPSLYKSHSLSHIPSVGQPVRGSKNASQNDCKCQLPFLISGDRNKPVVFSVFLRMDLFLLFYKWAFAAVLCTKVIWCIWSSGVLLYLRMFLEFSYPTINSLMQSAQCLAVAGGEGIWEQLLEPGCSGAVLQTCLSQSDLVLTPMDDGHRRIQTTNTNFLCVFAGEAAPSPEHSAQVFSSTGNLLLLQKERQMHGDSLPWSCSVLAACGVFVTCVPVAFWAVTSAVSSGR